MSTPITLTGAYTCTHHNDKQRTECPVCLVTQLRAELKDARRVINEQSTLRLTAEGSLAHLIVFKNEMHKRYEDDLATERARLDHREPRSITTQNKRQIARLELQRDQLRVEVKRLNELVTHILK